MMKKNLVLLLLTLCINTYLNAQDTIPIDTFNILKEIVITYQADKTTPITFQNISAKTLKIKSTGQEPSFLLAETPSITAYSDAGNTQGYSYFRLRGIDQTRINISLDGVPLNEPEDQGAYFSNYPDLLNSVSNIQIQRGVGTSKNGVASYGGSIQLLSPNLYDSAQTSFGMGYGSFNSLRVFTEYNSGIKKHKALYVRASEVYSQGYKYHSANHSQSIFLSGGLFYDKSTWKINLLAGHQQNQLAWLGVSDSLINRDRRTNANAPAEKDQFTQYLFQLQYKWQLGKHSTLQSSLYYTYLNGNYNFDFNNFIGLPSTNELYNYAFQSHLIGFFSNYTFQYKHLNWITGIHGNLYERRHTGSEKTFGELYQNRGDKNEISLFTKAAYTFHKFTLFTDIQYRYATFNYKGAVPLYAMQWHFLNPKAGISYTLKPNTVLYYSIGKTSREATRNDLFMGNDDLLVDSSGQAIMLVNTPESVIDQELGLRHQFKRLSLNANFYY